MTNADTAAPILSANVDGIYTVELTVSDGALGDTDTVVVTAGAVSVATSVSVDSVAYVTAGDKNGNNHCLSR